MLQVLVVSDVRLFREGVAQILDRVPTIEALPAAGSAQEALADVERYAPEVVLLDTGIPNALSFARALGERSQARVVALGLAEIDNVVAFAEAGIAGYVDREASTEDLVEAIESVLRRELRCSRKVAGALLRRVAVLSRRHDATEEVHLTPREQEIVALLDQGLTNKEIARKLHIELATVKNHVHNILDKLDVPTRGKAAAKARALHRLGRSGTRKPAG